MTGIRKHARSFTGRLLSQKKLVEVRAMDGHMAARALTRSLEPQPPVRHASLTVESGVALETQQAALAPGQHEIVNAAVRRVAGDAACHPRGGMLEDVRPAFLDMAGDACLPVGLSKLEGVHRPVGSMAVRAFHKPFGNAVVHGQRERGLDRRVAGETKLGLGPLQQATAQPLCLLLELRQCEEVGLRISKAALTQVLDLVH